MEFNNCELGNDMITLLGAPIGAPAITPAAVLFVGLHVSLKARYAVCGVPSMASTGRN